MYTVIIGLSAIIFGCNGDEPGPGKTEEEITFNTGEGEYYGSDDTDQAGIYKLMFRSGNFDSAGKPSGEAWEFYTDVFSEISTDMEKPALAAGNYTASSDGLKFTFTPGKSDDTGTYLIHHAVDGSVKKHYIASGTITVAVSVSGYTLTTDISDGSGMKYKCTYTGMMGFTYKGKTVETITFDSASGEYYGANEAKDAGIYRMLLRSGDFDDEGVPFGAAWELYADFLSEISEDHENADMAAGDYTPASASGADRKFTFVTGKNNGGTDTGTYFISYSESGTAKKHYIVSGTITIAVSGENYTVTTDIKANSGMSYECQYTGPVSFEYKGEPVPDELVADAAGGTYFGDLFGDGMAQYGLRLTKSELNEFGDIEGDGFKLYFEIFSEEAADPSAPTLKTGEYTSAEDPAKSTFSKGYLNEDTGKMMGSHIIEYTAGVRSVKAITGGKFTLDMTGGKYTLNAELTDEDERLVNVAFEGAIAFDNLSEIPESNTLEYCEGNYYGDRKGKGSGEYLLDVYMMDFTPEFKIIFRGLYLNGFMVPAADPEAVEIDTGIYTADGEITGTPLTFIPGDKTGDILSGSYYYETDTDMVTVVKTILITEGTYAVTKSGDEFTILTSFSGIDTANGEVVKDIKYKYTGTISIVDMTK